MPVRLQNIRIGLDTGEDRLAQAAAGRLGVDVAKIEGVRIVRTAVDSRHGRPVLIYGIDVILKPDVDAENVAERAGASLVAEPEEPRIVLGAGPEPLPGRPVIVGAGPAGLFAAYLLAMYGFRPLVMERGQSVAPRAKDIAAFFDGGTLDPESNILFGLGGAGTWSDGKLTWSPSDPMAAFVLHTFVRCGAPEQILVEAKPHIGTDLLRGVTAKLAEMIEAAGGEFRFGRRVDTFVFKGGRVAGVRCGQETTEAGAVVLAMGHSARDTVRVLADQGVAIEARPFQVGVRIEHPQEMIDRSQYGEAAGHPRLPSAEYSLRHKAHGGWRSVHSFCMCPGGMVVPSMNRNGEICTNGMSCRARDGEFANAALVVSVGPKDFGGGRLDGLAFQEEIERAAFAATGSFSAPAQTAEDFMKDRAGSVGKTSYPLGVVPVQWSRILPRSVYQSIVRALAMSFDRSIRGFAGAQGTILGPETRVTSPVRLVRHERTHESVSTPGLCPAGEGSGYAGGIVSSAVDGLRTARALIERHCPAE